MIGRFTNEKLEGYGKKFLPNMITQEGVFKNGIFQSDKDKHHLQLRERWFGNFTDEFVVEQLTKAILNTKEDTSKYALIKSMYDEMQ